MSAANWEKVGHINVDAGIVWIGDPCYILHKEKPPTSIGENWRGFCDKLYQLMVRGIAIFSYRKTSTEGGMGICVQTAHGDGSYPVYVKRNREGGVSRVIIKFE